MRSRWTTRRSSSRSAHSYRRSSSLLTLSSLQQLFTKAYEFFKAHKSKNMTFFVASQIALAHYEGGNHEMALKFHDRILKNYRKDKWRTILDSLLQLSAHSAIEIGEDESAIRALIELLAPGGSPMSSHHLCSTHLKPAQTPASPSSNEQATRFSCKSS